MVETWPHVAMHVVPGPHGLSQATGDMLSSLVQPTDFRGSLCILDCLDLLKRYCLTVLSAGSCVTHQWSDKTARISHGHKDHATP